MMHEIRESMLVINTGSSSVKFQIFSIEPMLELLARGKVNDLGSTPLFTATDEMRASQDKHVEKTELPTDYTHENALEFILHWLEAQNQNWQVRSKQDLILQGIKDVWEEDQKH